MTDAKPIAQCRLDEWKGKLEDPRSFSCSEMNKNDLARSIALPLIAEVEQLRSDLAEYGYHRNKCKILLQMAGPRPITEPCDCGWQDTYDRATGRGEA